MSESPLFASSLGPEAPRQATIAESELRWAVRYSASGPSLKGSAESRTSRWCSHVLSCLRLKHTNAGRRAQGFRPQCRQRRFDQGRIRFLRLRLFASRGDRERAASAVCLTPRLFISMRIECTRSEVWPRITLALTISGVMESVRVGATKRINRSRGERGLLCQPCFFDRALRSVKEYNEKVEYLHLLT